jgi:hypothetical protein
LSANQRLDAWVRVSIQAARASFHSADLPLLTVSALVPSQALERLVQGVAVEPEIKIRDLTLLGCLFGLPITRV